MLESTRVERPAMLFDCLPTAAAACVSERRVRHVAALFFYSYQGEMVPLYSRMTLGTNPNEEQGAENEQQPSLLFCELHGTLQWLTMQKPRLITIAHN
jgi:hypothetical protein